MRRIARHLPVLVPGLVLVPTAPASVAAVPDVLDRLAERGMALDPEVPDAEAIRPYASRDTVEWTIGAFGGAEFGITELAFLRTGIDWFVRDGFSLGLQLDVGGIRVGGTGYTGAIGSAAVNNKLPGRSWLKGKMKEKAQDQQNMYRAFKE